MSPLVDYNEDELQFAAVSAFLKLLPSKQLPRLTARQQEAQDEFGYDVELTLDPKPGDRGTSIFLQFKRPYLVKRPPKAVLRGGKPSRSFALKTRPARNVSKSQHEVLCELNDKHECRVYYVSSLLDSWNALCEAHVQDNVLDQLLCIHPRAIGVPSSNARSASVYFGYSRAAWSVDTEWFPHPEHGRSASDLLKYVKQRHLADPPLIREDAQSKSLAILDLIGGKEALPGSLGEEFFLEGDELSLDFKSHFSLEVPSPTYQVERLRSMVRAVLDMEVVFLLKKDPDANP